MTACRTLLLLGCLLAVACTRLPVNNNLPIQLPSPNHNERRANFIILHQTSNRQAVDALRTLTNPFKEVSAHYLIARNGTLFQLVDEQRRAWHAGRSYWGGLTDLNSASIGIELDNDGNEPFPAAQIERLLELLRQLSSRYRIPAANIIGHGDIAPGRKVDPSRFFPWQQLAQQGFGLWCDAPEKYPPPPIETLPLLLATLGYDPRLPQAALAAFRRHFLGTDEETAVSENEMQWLACLVAAKSRARDLPDAANKPASGAD